MIHTNDGRIEMLGNTIDIVSDFVAVIKGFRDMMIDTYNMTEESADLIIGECGRAAVLDDGDREKFRTSIVTVFETIGDAMDEKEMEEE